MRHSPAPVALLFLLTAQAAAQLDPRLLDQDLLDEITAEVRPAVTKATGIDLSDVKFRVVKPRELAVLVAKESLSFKSTKMTKGQARLQGFRVSKLLLGKFKWTTNEVLLCPKNFEWQSRSMKNPDLLTRAMYVAVVVHESVHAVDEKRHQWSKVVTALSDTKRFDAYQAVIEGNAQRVTAEVCKVNGWEQGFEIFTKHVGSTGGSEDAAQDLLLKLLSANSHANYHEGRKFAAYVQAKAGDKGIARAFAEPPLDFEAILNPEWFLHPKTRPKKLYDFTLPLKKFGEGFSADGWTRRKIAASIPQLRAGFSILPKEQVDQVFDHMTHNSMLVLNDKERPGSRLVVAALFEFDSPEGARMFVVADTALVLEKDKRFAKGPIRVLHAKSVDLEDFGMVGTLFQKTMKTPSGEVEVITLVSGKGSVAVELTYSNWTVTHRDAATLAKALLDRSALIKPEKRPEPKKTATKK